ncbi:MAG TPA: hypothetical protein DE045_07790 [Oceanospirillaceae bacterium]|nr:hypothetical protein [Oceanospirillaceae bacterium]
MPSPFLTAINEFMQVHRYSQRTIHTYIYWIKGYIRFERVWQLIGKMQRT